LPGWTSWLARGLALAALCAGLYLRNPSSADYAPFGMAFTFIGSGLALALAVLCAVTSLFFLRPWCNTLCPVKTIFDYLLFARSWLDSALRRKP
jgi:polyferredoxin